MKQNKLLGVLTIALTLVLSACNGGGGGKSGSSKAASHKHEYGDWQVVTAATCTEGGSEKRICKNSDGKCTKVEDTRTTSALGHQKPDPFVAKSEVPATCEGAGSVTYECQRCHQDIEEATQALGHDWETAADQSGALEPTCTEAGEEIQVCKNDPTHTRKVAIDALGHDFPENGTLLPIPGAEEKNTKGEIPFQWAEITNYSCTRGDSYRYAWSAKEVNFDYKNEGVHFTQEEITAAQEGDPAYGKTTNDWKSEPNLLDEGDGIRFWGRPIGNAMALSSEGRASGQDDVKIPDESVKGSRFEFDFEFDADVNDVCLSAELTPAQYTNDIFKNRPNDQEWTPGYRFVDDGQGGRKEEMIETFRYIILLDGVEVPLDANVNTAPNGRGWYQFPCKLNLTKGKHNLNIAMAGGYLHTFYQFSFEKVAPAHEHRFSAGEKAADSALRAIECSCGVSGYELQAADLTEGQNAPDPTNKDTRLGKNKFDDVWNITGIASGSYEVYLQARASAGNASKGYWNSAAAVAAGDSEGNNGGAELSKLYKYQVKVGDGEYVNLGDATSTYADYGLTENSNEWTNKPLATITIANGATSITVHNLNNGYSIWVFGLRLVQVAA